jgi:hypothetical protein
MSGLVGYDSSEDEAEHHLSNQKAHAAVLFGLSFLSLQELTE